MAYQGYRKARGVKDPAQDPKAPVTDNRRSFVENLLLERDVDAEIKKIIQGQLDGEMTNAQGKQWIAFLMPLPRVERDDAVTEPGFYKHRGDIYKVQISKAGRAYALVQEDDGTWELAKGAVFRLSANEMMTDAQIKRAKL